MFSQDLEGNSRIFKELREVGGWEGQKGWVGLMLCQGLGHGWCLHRNCDYQTLALNSMGRVVQSWWGSVGPMTSGPPWSQLLGASGRAWLWDIADHPSLQGRYRTRLLEVVTARRVCVGKGFKADEDTGDPGGP